MDKNLSPSSKRYASARTENPGYITLHIMGNRYTFPYRVIGEMVRQILPLLPYQEIFPHDRYKRMKFIFLAIGWIIVAVVLWNESFTTPPGIIVKWFYFLSAIQSISFVYLAWKE